MKIYKVMGCPLCDRLLRLMKKYDKKVNPKNKEEYHVYMISRTEMQSDQQFATNINTNEKEQLMRPVKSYPTIRFNNGKELIGDDCIEYIENKIRKKDFIACPIRKLKPCIQNKCAWWLEWMENGNNYGDCSIHTFGTLSVELRKVSKDNKK